MCFYEQFEIMRNVNVFKIKKVYVLATNNNYCCTIPIERYSDVCLSNDKVDYINVHGFQTNKHSLHNNYTDAKLELIYLMIYNGINEDDSLLCSEGVVSGRELKAITQYIFENFPEKMI